jgi:hypothetical protein
MAYREQSEHLRARIAELEDELAEAQKRLRELEGSGRRDRAGFWEKVLGARLHLTHELRVPGELPKHGHELVIERVRQHFGVLGQPSSVGRTLTWTTANSQTQRAVEVSVIARDDETRVRVSERLGNVAGGVFGGIVGGLGGGGSGLAVGAAMWLGVPRLVPLFLAIWVLSVFSLVRVGFARMVAKRDADLAAAAREIEASTRTVIAKARTPQVRVETDTDDEAEDAEQPAEKLRARRED